MKVRNCRTCSKVLPSSRYFKCHTCQPILPTDIDDDTLYDTEDGLDEGLIQMVDGLFEGNEAPLSVKLLTDEEILEGEEDAEYSSEIDEQEWNSPDEDSFR